MMSEQEHKIYCILSNLHATKKYLSFLEDVWDKARAKCPHAGNILGDCGHPKSSSSNCIPCNYDDCPLKEKGDE